jgi:molybdenum cofactor cytidylyltransferase
MGRPKALLSDREGRPFVARVVRAFHDAGVMQVTVVTGSQHDAIVAALAADRLRVAPHVVRNPDPSRGQLSSLWTGLDAVAAEAPALLMTLVDVPMLRPSTIRAVVDTWERTHAPIVRPAMGERHGHPVLFDRSLFEELRRAPLDQGAKVVVHAYADRLINVQVDDDGSLTDIDTPAEYEQAMKRLP